jgi:hypothetical protein
MNLQEVKLRPRKPIQAIDRDLIPRPEVIEHAPKFRSVPFGSGL